jgi:uncharacterized protein YydD (DUF2326 family)
MIRAVRADKPGFKTVEFLAGLNVVLAERTKESSSKDSRNGLGKSTLIDIIHFCLGSDPDKRDTLRQPPLKDWTFELELTVRGTDLQVRRSTSDPGKVFVEGDVSDWPIETLADKSTGIHICHAMSGRDSSVGRCSTSPLAGRLGSIVRHFVV